MFLIGRYLRIFFSETAWPGELKLYMKHLWKDILNDCSFRLDVFTNMTAIGNSFSVWSISKFLLLRNCLSKPIKILQEASMAGPLQEILISTCLDKKHDLHGHFLGWDLKIFSSETRRHNELLLGRNGIWEILYKISILCGDCTTDMTAIGSSC